MSRLIDADAIKNGKFHSVEDWTPIEQASWQRGWNDAIDAIIDNAPTVDAVEVVRCKDCVGCDRDDGSPWCGLVGLHVDDDHYCAWGERREDGKIG